MMSLQNSLLPPPPTSAAAAKPWLGFEPRAWQLAALDSLLSHLASPSPSPVIVRAVMGSGKSLIIASLAARIPDSILISTPTIALVDQLAETIQICTGEPVARFYTHGKSIARITVACNDSAAEAADAIGRVALWMSDEAHRSEGPRMKTVAQAVGLDVNRIGFTATPWRADPSEKLRLWDHLICDYGPADAIRDGVVVPPRIVPWTGGETTTDDAVLSMTRDAVGPGIHSAFSIADAEAFAALLNHHGRRAAAIHCRMSRSQIKIRIHSLEIGELSEIVHVNMLSEGVDFPWLRWFCARRRVRSRVRFAQEIGRALRAFPEKKEAVIYDPHALWDDLKLDYAACLGEIEEPDEIAVPLETETDEDRLARVLLDGTTKIPGATSLDAAEARLMVIAASLEVAGLLKSSVNKGRWRREPVSEKQKNYLGKNKTWIVSAVAGLPQGVKQSLKDGFQATFENRISKGGASDLISIFMSLANLAKDSNNWRRWPRELVAQQNEKEEIHS